MFDEPSYDEISRLIQTKQKQSVEITPVFSKENNTLSRTTSKIGGHPYAPLNFEYPKCANRPMILLAQINLSEVNGYSELPNKGMLQFYIAFNAGVYGHMLEESEYQTYKVVYHPEVIEDIEHQNTPVANEYYEMPFKQEHKMIFREQKMECITPSDFDFEETIGYDLYELDDSVGEKVYNEYLSYNSKLGGYPNFSQIDPRMNDFKIEDNVLLFQIVSEIKNDCDIMFGDMGVANFFINPKDLKELNFDNVYYHFSCG